MMKIAKKMSRKHINVKKQNPIALLPIAVFLVLYLGLGILFEYVMKIPMGFYNVPIIIAFLVAILVACQPVPVPLSLAFGRISHYGSADTPPVLPRGMLL